jgi:hypothetical protein
MPVSQRRLWLCLLVIACFFAGGLAGAGLFAAIGYATLYLPAALTGGTWTAVTPRVFCAVSAAIADSPCTPCAANVFRSAWMPAPPPESEPAMVRALGMRVMASRGRAGRLLYKAAGNSSIMPPN